MVYLFLAGTDACYDRGDIPLLAGTDACYDRGGIMVYHFLAGTHACYHRGIPLFGWGSSLRSLRNIYIYIRARLR